MTPEEAAVRIAELEAELEEQRFENGVLRLQLDVLSTTDIVTGLPNLNGMLQVIENALARHDRSGESFGVMSVHVPALTSIHDRYGRDAVKDASRHAGAMVAAGLRQLDSVGRLDDTSFIVALPMLDGAGAEVVIDRIGQMLQSVPITFGEHSVRMVPSIAVVLIPPGPAPNVDEVINHLYEAREDAVPGAPVIVDTPVRMEDELG